MDNTHIQIYMYSLRIHNIQKVTYRIRIHNIQKVTDMQTAIHTDSRTKYFTDKYLPAGPVSALRFWWVWQSCRCFTCKVLPGDVLQRHTKESPMLNFVNRWCPCLARPFHVQADPHSTYHVAHSPLWRSWQHGGSRSEQPPRSGVQHGSDDQDDSATASAPWRERPHPEQSPCSERRRWRRQVIWGNTPVLASVGLCGTVSSIVRHVTVSSFVRCGSISSNVRCVTVFRAVRCGSISSNVRHVTVSSLVRCGTFQ